MQISRIIVHEGYNVFSYDSDIALLQLTEPAILTRRVQLICLPTRHDIIDEAIKEGKHGWVRREIFYSLFL